MFSNDLEEGWSHFRVMVGSGVVSSQVNDLIGMVSVQGDDLNTG